MLGFGRGANMDPNTTLELIDDAIFDGDREAAREHRANLRTWLSKGGFEPTWNDYPRAARFCGRDVPMFGEVTA